MCVNVSFRRASVSLYDRYVTPPPMDPLPMRSHHAGVQQVRNAPECPIILHCPCNILSLGVCLVYDAVWPCVAGGCTGTMYCCRLLPDSRAETWRAPSSMR